VVRVRPSAIVLVLGLLLILVIVSGCAKTEAQSNPSGTGVTLVVTPVPHPDIFSDPTRPVVDSTGALAPDARRVLTVMALQLSLEEFRRAQGQYPTPWPSSSRLRPPG